jgi:pimeloyl-ACP methyl ester carboxylesterase
MHVEPFFREAGTGHGVVCTHSNASTSGQWRGLMDLQAPNFHVLAPDLYDSDRSPQWPSDRLIRLREEVALIDPNALLARVLTARAGLTRLPLSETISVAAKRAPPYLRGISQCR